MKDRLGPLALMAVLIIATLTAWTPQYWGATVIHAGLFGLGAVWAAISAVRQRMQWISTWLYVPLVAVAIWGPLQLVLGTTVYRFATAQASLHWLVPLVTFTLATQWLQQRSARETFLNVLVIFGFILVVVSVLQSITAPNLAFWLFESPFRVIGPFVYRNQFAAFVALLLPISLVRMMSQQNQSVGWGFISATMFAAVVMSASRAGTILLAAETVTVLVAGWSRGLVSSRVAGLLFLQITVLLGLCVGVVGWEALGSHFQDQTSGAIRTKLFQSTLHMIGDRPWQGWGLGTWTNVYPAYALFDNSQIANAAHADWAQWTAEGGVPFALFLLWIAGRSIGYLWRSLWGLGVLAIFAYSFVDYPTREPVLSAILFALLGAMVTASQERSETIRIRRKRQTDIRRKLPIAS